MARTPMAWFVDSIPDLQIGAIDDDDDANVFGRIEGVAQKDTSRLAVFDGRSLELKVFSASGEFLYRRGGKGSGPGEFLLASRIRAWPTSSMVLYDNRQSRLTVYSVEGAMSIVAVSSSGVRGRNELAVGRLGDKVVMGTTGLFVKPRQGEYPLDSINYRLVDPRTGEVRTLGVFPGARLFSHVFKGETIPLTGYLPYDIMPSLAVRSDALFITAGEGPTIHEYDAGGVLRRVIRLDEPPRKPKPTDLEHHVVNERRRRDSLNAIWVDMYRKFPLPTELPAFNSLLVDETGTLWAEVYSLDRTRPTVWLVFDHDGRGLGSVETPAGLKVQQIGTDFVLGTIRDGFGVDYVRRYRLHRQPAKPL